VRTVGLGASGDDAGRGHAAGADLVVPVSVLVRCRPLQPPATARLQLAVEAEGPDKVSLTVDPCGLGAEVQRDRNAQPRSFYCNAFCDEGAGQEDVFIHATPIVDRVMEGYNGTIFCYGITGSGKTYTMSGPLQDQQASQPQNHGIMQRAARRVFEFIRDRSANGEVFSVEASFLEIYSGDGVRETLVDLLAEGALREEPKLEVRQDPLAQHAFVCDGLRSVPIRSPDEMCEVLEAGRRRSTFMETTRNCVSSRSHCLFMVTIECLMDEQGSSDTVVRRGKLVLVDLAGSESLKKVAAANEADEELRRRQAIGINRVLSHLGTVVNNLNAGYQNGTGFRNSALTMLLRDCLGGNARALLIANMGPEAEWWSETTMTLTFAQQMMQVRNVEKATFISREKSTLMQMRQRHLECIQRLQEKAYKTDDSPESEEWQKLQREVDDLNRRLLTRRSATETLEQMQEEQSRRMDELRDEVTRTMTREFASLQEQSLRDLEGLRHVIETKAREGGELVIQRQREAYEAQFGALQSDLEASVEARHVAIGDAAELRVQLAATEQQVQTLQALQEDFLRERANLEDERRALRQQAEEQYRRLADLEGEMQRYRTEAGMQSEEADRLRGLHAAEVEAAKAERKAWALREAEIQSRVQAARAELERGRSSGADVAHEADRAHREAVELLRSQVTRLEAEGVVQVMQLEEAQRSQAALEAEVQEAREREAALRHKLEEEIRTYDEDINEAQHRVSELMTMLTEVQSSIMYATAATGRTPTARTPTSRTPRM